MHPEPSPRTAEIAENASRYRESMTGGVSPMREPMPPMPSAIAEMDELSRAIEFLGGELDQLESRLGYVLSPLIDQAEPLVGPDEPIAPFVDHLRTARAQLDAVTRHVRELAGRVQL